MSKKITKHALQNAPRPLNLSGHLLFILHATLQSRMFLPAAVLAIWLPLSRVKTRGAKETLVHCSTLIAQPLSGYSKFSFPI